MHKQIRIYIYIYMEGDATRSSYRVKRNSDVIVTWRITWEKQTNKQRYKQTNLGMKSKEQKKDMLKRKK